jgi:hypothetical protein
MKTVQKLRSIINKINFRKHKQTDSATVRYYIQITGRFGVKFFTRKRACEECFFRQEAAYRMKFAPKPLFIGKKKGYYYYVTEHAQLGKLSIKELSELRRTVGKMGWCTFDLFSDNVGKVNGKPVLIDFDNCTLG